MEVALDIIVRSTDIDMLGHVNNSKYQEYLEWGRFEWFRGSGIPSGLFTKHELSAVVVNVNINYRAEARMDDRLRIVTALVQVGRASIRYAHRVLHTDGRVACDASVTGVMFDTKLRKSAPIPDDVRPELLRVLCREEWALATLPFELRG